MSDVPSTRASLTTKSPPEPLVSRERPTRRCPPYPPRVLTDEEAADIRKKLEEGWRGPVLLTWLYRLLEDREKRVRRENPVPGHLAE